MSFLVKVEKVTKLSAVTGSAVSVHRYMAAGSCIGVEVWQRGGLLGVQLEEELTSLVCTMHKQSVCLDAAP